MSRQGRERATKAATVVAGVAVLASTVLLVADAAVAAWRAPANVERIESLEEQVKSNAQVAAELEEERKRQTETSLVRETAQQYLAWILLVATTGLVTGSKWLLVRRPAEGAQGEQSLRLPFDQASPTSPREAGEPEKVLVQLSGKGTSGESPEPAGSAEPPGSAEPAEPEVDLGWIGDLVTRHGRGREAAIPILQAIQEHFRYLPDDAMRHLCKLTEITPAQIAGTSTFYSRFRHSPVGEHLVRICQGTACHVAGAHHVDQELRRRLAIPPGDDTDPERRFTLEPVACVGCCSLAPVMMIGDETAGHLTPATAGDRLAAMVATEEGA